MIKCDPKFQFVKDYCESFTCPKCDENKILFFSGYDIATDGYYVKAGCSKCEKSYLNKRVTNLSIGLGRNAGVYEFSLKVIDDFDEAIAKQGLGGVGFGHVYGGKR